MSSHSYATVRDCLDRQSEDSLRELADDPQAETLAWSALERALEDATDEIDAYVGARHDLPLETVPRLLVRLCVEIGVYRRALHSDARIEENRRRYEDAVRLLDSIRSGGAGLGVADPDPPAEAESPAVSVESAPRVMTRRSLRGIL